MQKKNTFSLLKSNLLLNRLRNFDIYRIIRLYNITSSLNYYIQIILNLYYRMIQKESAE